MAICTGDWWWCMNNDTSRTVPSTNSYPLNAMLNATGIDIFSFMTPIMEYICAEMTLKFYFRSGDRVAVSDVMRLISKCSSTPEVVFRKLLDDGKLKPTTDAKVVEVA